MQASREHNNNFNLIRLVAALQVLLVHAANHFGYQSPIVKALKVVPGVPAFFFISGFLIFAAYERTRAKGISSFFVNRALRIYPALLVCVALSVIAVYLTGYFDGMKISRANFIAWIAGQTTFFQFYNPEFMRGFGVGVLNGALWTISVELQFYMLTPLLYYLIRERSGLAAAIFFGSMALNLFFREHFDWNLLYMKLVYVSFAPWVYMFLFGCFAAARGEIAALASKIDLKYMLVAYVLSMNLIGGYTTNASNAINPISFAILALMITKLATMNLRIGERVKRFIKRTDVSYGLYLYHMPVINFLLFFGAFSTGVSIAVGLACSLTAAVLSWYLIEKPALGWKM